MAATNGEKYRYNNIDERYKRMNKIYFSAASLLWVMFFIYLFLKMFSKSIQPVIVYANSVLILIYMVINPFVYLKDKASHKFKTITAIEMGLEVFLIGAQTNAEFILYAMLGIMALQIPYYDKKVFKKLYIGDTIVYTIIVIARAIKGTGGNDVDSVCRTICVYLMIYVIAKVGNTAKEFSDDALGSAEEQGEKQKRMLDGIVGVSQTVQEEAGRSSELVDTLVGRTETVATSMQEIAEAANTTALSIEEQNNMTQSIQTAIGETSERSKRMVDIALDSNDSIQENMRVMETLKDQSRQIAETNQEVTDSMVRLQNKTKEVEEIAGIILSISGQTNLLALNASIESARAGEAGRGFAVVAEQIRQLAEQTKSSTEDITRIINELNENANEVVASVENSVSATESQNEKILSASESFEKLNANMSTLIQHINEINDQIMELSDSNNKIVENISQLSAATQQVTASADQVREISQQNMDYAEQVKDAIGMIEGTTDNMKQYL